MTGKEGNKKEAEKEEAIYVINAEYLSGYNDALVDDMANFLGEKIEGKVKRDGTDILINAHKGVSKTALRTLLKKFIHKNNIKNAFKILSPAGKGNILILQKIKEL
ncbi:MAG: 60S ribosomal protein L22 [Candidatus Odinarchaeia archaeon]